MNKQEYQHIRNLAWDILNKAKIQALPIDIASIAKLYNVENYLKHSETLYNNTVIVSTQILEIYGYNADFAKYLAIRLMSPIIILKELKITSAEDIANITGLPLNIAKKRYERYQMLLVRNAFETSHLETKVLNQFQDWLNQHN
jgi:hypothetical protein